MFSKFISDTLLQKKLWFLVLLAVTVMFLWKNVDISIMLFVSIIFATALDPLVNKLEKKMKRPFATLLVLLPFLLITALIILPILYLAIYEIVEFAKAFPVYVNNIHSLITAIPVIGPAFKLNSVSLMSTFASSSTSIFDSILSMAKGATEVLLYIVTGILLLFFFLVDKIRIKKAILKLFPAEYREKTDKILDNVACKLSGYIVAQTLVSSCVWLVMTIGLLIFKINYAVLLGLIAGVLSIIPVVGPLLSILISVIATYDMGLKYLIIVLAIYLFTHSIESHLVRPYVYSKFLNIHLVIIFLALLIGAKYQGILGVLLAPPLAMTLYILLEELYVKKMDE